MKNLKITVNGVAYDVQVEEVGSDSAPSAPSAPAPAAPKAPAAPAAPKAPVAGETVNSPMPGTVLEVQIKPDYVKSGDTLLVLEAMKMENAIAAPKDGKVVEVYVIKGQTVESGTALVTIG